MVNLNWVPEFWELSKNLGSDDEEDEYDQAFKRKGPTINVKKINGNLYY